MSSVITLRTGLVAGCALALVSLTACTHTATQPADPVADFTRLDLSDALKSTPAQLPTPAVETGTDAGLITTPASVPAPAPAGHQRTTSTPAPSAAAVAPPAVEFVIPAPVVVEPAAVAAPEPVEPTCGAGELWDPTVPACVAQQLPDESTGGARCPDALQVVVAILPDGTLVCGPVDDATGGAA